MLIALLLAPAARAQLASIEGTIDWGDDVAIPRGARLEITLQRLEGRAVTLSEQRLMPAEAPVRFALAYDGRLTPAGGAFRLLVRLTLEGRLVREARRPVTLDPNRDGPIKLFLGAPRELAEASALVGPTWTAMVARGEALPPYARARLSFGPDGAVSGSTGCNDLQGRAEVGAETIDFGALVQTRRGCKPEQMRAERRVLGALRRATGWVVEGPELRLTNERGEVVALYRSDL